MPKVAVVYLARAAHGIDAFVPFASSYKKFNAGYDHELILLGKGMSKKWQHSATSALFNPFPHRIIKISEKGFDIHAYLRVAKMLDHDYICFFNTYSELTSNKWLEKMMHWGIKPEVGIVGTSASYQSLHDLGKLVHKLNWLISFKNVKLDRETTNQFSFILNAKVSEESLNWRKKTIHSIYLRFIQMVKNILKPRVKYSTALDHEFDLWWEKQTAPGDPLAYYTAFPSFPNPHIRSNGFLISRKLLLSFDYNLENTKIACSHFESGPQSISKKIQQKNLKLILTGADGAAYGVENWAKSSTFRSGNQENLLVYDNHSREFFNFDKTTKEQYQRMTWGENCETISPHYHKANGSLESEYNEIKYLSQN